MYKILNKLFGWDYILWQDGTGKGCISRVHVDKCGTVWYWRYKSIGSMDRIFDQYSVKLWLTCHPDKYFK